MGYFKHCHQVENMLRQALVVLCIALAVQAKTRKGPLPHLFWDQVKHLETVDEPENKIVGGEEVDISERPFQIVFLYYGSLRCGGAWMGGKNILTAAHCCDGVSASSVSVRLGSSKHASGGEVIDVSQVIPNPAYDDFDISNDACILVLESEPTNSVAAPVDLPSSAMDIPEGASFVVSGWGTTSEGGSLPSNLMQVTVPYVNDDDCSDAYGSGNIVGDVMICAGEGGKDSCQGDMDVLAQPTLVCMLKLMLSWISSPPTPIKLSIKNLSSKWINSSNNMRLFLSRTFFFLTSNLI